MVNEGINLAGIKRVIELESAMSNMAIEVAKLRIEVDALLELKSEKIGLDWQKSLVVSPRSIERMPQISG
jgi:MerR family transcriptional regulator/heat shock protein HspR